MCQLRFVEAVLTSKRFQPDFRSTTGDGSYWPGIFTGALLSHARTAEPSMRARTLQSSGDEPPAHRAHVQWLAFGSVAGRARCFQSEVVVSAFGAAIPFDGRIRGGEAAGAVAAPAEGMVGGDFEIRRAELGGRKSERG